jgi:predicted DNA-binding transcriptional regulator YafY
MSPGQRSTAAQQVRRVNAAAKLLRSGRTVVEAARELTCRLGVSERQARRYAEQARDSGSKAIPKPKVVFTVKLPMDLVRQLRHRARMDRRTLSSLVAQALERFLTRARAGRRGGV